MVQKEHWLEFKLVNYNSGQVVSQGPLLHWEKPV
jgi:hypothetical protein